MNPALCARFSIFFFMGVRGGVQIIGIKQRTAKPFPLLPTLTIKLLAL
jgi:hypothetical protein